MLRPVEVLKVALSVVAEEVLFVAPTPGIPPFQLAAFAKVALEVLIHVALAARALWIDQGNSDAAARRITG